MEIDAPYVRLGVTLDGNGSGEVNAGAAPAPVGGTIVDCGAGGTCYANYANGSQVTLTATASSGFEFTGWGDCSGAGTASNAQVLVDTSRQCSASFVLRQFTLGGTVNGLSSGTLVLQLDSDSSPTTQTKSLTANGAYSFDTAFCFRQPLRSQRANPTGWSDLHPRARRRHAGCGQCQQHRGALLGQHPHRERQCRRWLGHGDAGDSGNRQ